jgi:single-strand DNA-binding protein
LSDIATGTLTGRLGRDPETKSFPSGGEVVNFSLAQDQYNGKRDKTTSWWECECWSPAKALLQYVSKGDQVTLVGNFRQDRPSKDEVYYKFRVEDIVLSPKAHTSDGERVRSESEEEDESDEPW